MYSEENQNDNVAIEVNNISKCYNIYEKPRDRLLQMFARTHRKFYREFWALKNINFSIGRGETVGIIGRNGSGKSTLLQIICGTLNSSSGEVITRGRIAALLELGSGFNPEFTGSENIYMNGAILGLSRSEMDSKYSDIVQFADIGDFINQPVKNYSSGMQVRLAFSVAIHVEPEILVVDEALSVGDAYFQAKCAQAIAKIIESGATVLFVSHDISSVKSLCSRAILMDKGEVSFIGDVATAIEKYYAGLVNENNTHVEKSEQVEISLEEGLDENLFEGKALFEKQAEYQRISKGKVSFLNVLLLDKNNKRKEDYFFGDLVTLRQVIKINEDIPRLGLAYHIRDKHGQDIVYSDTEVEEIESLRNLKSGEVYFIDWKFKVNLREGRYVISSMASIPENVNIGDVNVQDFIPISFTFSVVKGKSLPIYGTVYWDNEVKIQRLTDV
ncbi:ABC transporter ATP-binding protein [Atlantibacter hermannii]|uniref:ABC transporter ATP-binding protein n=1 Tax=Atlantibacter hermannii TaxID=565 RepID=UPI00254DF409|nr:ABC transporter ATP-binding protein [Atlantibacter hermannii]